VKSVVQSLPRIFLRLASFLLVAEMAGLVHPALLPALPVQNSVPYAKRVLWPEKKCNQGHFERIDNKKMDEQAKGIKSHAVPLN